MTPFLFDHIALESDSIADTVSFYRDTFAAAILYQDPTWALIEIGAAKIAFVTPGDHPPHLSFKVDTHLELEQLAAHHNAVIKVHRDRSESFYLYDPHHNAIEIIWYPPDSN